MGESVPEHPGPAQSSPGDPENVTWSCSSSQASGGVVPCSFSSSPLAVLSWGWFCPIEDTWGCLRTVWGIIACGDAPDLGWVETRDTEHSVVPRVSHIRGGMQPQMSAVLRQTHLGLHGRLCLSIYVSIYIYYLSIYLSSSSLIETFILRNWLIRLWKLASQNL